MSLLPRLRRLWTTLASAPQTDRPRDYKTRSAATRTRNCTLQCVSTGWLPNSWRWMRSAAERAAIDIAGRERAKSARICTMRSVLFFAINVDLAGIARLADQGAVPDRPADPSALDSVSHIQRQIRTMLAACARVPGRLRFGCTVMSMSSSAKRHPGSTLK